MKGIEIENYGEVVISISKYIQNVDMCISVKIVLAAGDSKSYPNKQEKN